MPPPSDAPVPRSDRLNCRVPLETKRRLLVLAERYGGRLVPAIVDAIDQAYTRSLHGAAEVAAAEAAIEAGKR